MIILKTGEHPLATKCRKLHRELFRAYALLSFTSTGIGVAIIANGHPLTSIVLVLMAWGFAVMAQSEWKWSK